MGVGVSVGGGVGVGSGVGEGRVVGVGVGGTAVAVWVVSAVGTAVCSVLETAVDVGSSIARQLIENNVINNKRTQFFRPVCFMLRYMVKLYPTCPNVRFNILPIFIY
jgi:hypothetical protein